MPLENIKFTQIEHSFSPRYRVSGTWGESIREVMLTLDESAALRILSPSERYKLAERKLVKESEINEISDKTIGSYIEKAEGDKVRWNAIGDSAQHRAKRAATTGNAIDLDKFSDEMDKAREKAAKREAGIVTAKKRLKEDALTDMKKSALSKYTKMITESAMQLHEVSPSLLGRYISKASADKKIKERDYEEAVKDYLKHDTEENDFKVSRLYNKRKQREKGMSSAYKKLADGQYNESSELDEASDNFIPALKQAFASEYAFYLKAHNFHWNVEGSNFKEYHTLFGDIYEEVYDSIDEFAENIRKVGEYAPGSLNILASLSEIKGEDKVLGPAEMTTILLADSEKMSDVFAKVYQMAERVNDFGLANFLADRQDAHKKHSWMLRSTLKEGVNEEVLDETVLRKTRITDGTSVIYTKNSIKMSHPEKGNLTVKWNKNKAKYIHPEHGEIDAYGHMIPMLFVQHGYSLGLKSKTNEEVLDELKLSTLNNYIGKALVNNAEDRMSVKLKSAPGYNLSDDNVKFLGKRIGKRSKGIRDAWTKQGAGEYDEARKNRTNEEVTDEQCYKSFKEFNNK